MVKKTYTEPSAKEDDGNESLTHPGKEYKGGTTTLETSLSVVGIIDPIFILWSSNHTAGYLSQRKENSCSQKPIHKCLQQYYSPLSKEWRQVINKQTNTYIIASRDMSRQKKWTI